MLAARTPIAIAGPWQIGKSAFFQHVLRVMIRDHDQKTGATSTLIRINVPEIVADCQDEGQFFRRVLREIGDEALVVQEGKLPEELSKPAKLRRLMERELRRRGRIVLAFEGAGALAKLNDRSREWFVSSMKSWADAWDEPWDRLQMVMDLTTSPEVLDRNVTVSPWNVRPVMLGEFTASQSAELAKAHDLDWSEHQIEQCLAVDFGGYPALLCAIMERAQAAKRPIESFALGGSSSFAGHPVLPLLEQIYAMAAHVPELLTQIYMLISNAEQGEAPHGGHLVTDMLLQRLLATGVIKLDHANGSGGRRFAFGCRAYEAYFRERMFSRARMN